MTSTSQVLEKACAQVGLVAQSADLIRAAENTLFRLPGGIVARVTRTGQMEVASKEVRVSRWLQQVGIPVVQALPTIEQPVDVDGRAVTFWQELPPHRHGGIAEVADMLRQIHRLQPPPELALPALTPFVRLEQRITEATIFDTSDRDWLSAHLHHLIEQYETLPTGLPRTAVHGDAWGGNVVIADGHGPVVLDLERFAYGPPEWDLTSIAVDHTTFGSLTNSEWTLFCQRYGHDVTDWAGHHILRDIRELRKVTFAAQMAVQYPGLSDQARYRLACIRRRQGPRPWYWKPLP